MMSPQGLWVALPAGLAQIDSVSGRVLRTIAYPPEARPIGRTRRAVTAPDGSIWASFSGGGLFQYRNGQWRREPALSLEGQRNPLALLVDGAGRVWLTYADGSVAVLDKGAVRTYPLQLGKVPALFEQAGQVWVAGEHGLALWRDGRFTTLRSADAHAFEGVVSLLRALDAADRVLEEGRDQVHQLRTGDTDDEPWPDALRREGERLAALHGVAFRYLESGKPQALPAAARHEIRRIAGEALRNAFVHARAALIELELRHARGMVQLDVRDDGSGLPPALASGGQVAGHWGLPGMRERAAAIGAELALITREGGGTHWRLRVPLDWKRRWLQRWRRRS